MKAIAQADAIPDFQVAIIEDAEAEPTEGRGRGRRAPSARVIVTARPRVLEDLTEEDANHTDM